MVDIQEKLADDVARSRRIRAALAMVENLPTEDIEMVNERLPHLAEEALHEILNPKPFVIREIPVLYEVAKRITLENGLPWTDPRTGETFQP